jgi:spore germination cell wall hydrolase CwlJ-like protein
LLKYISVFMAALLLPFSNAQAREWNITIPDWIGSLSNSINLADEIEQRRELACIALAVYYESRGESIRGQRAVASVVMNRVRDPRFPNTACGVLLQRYQFSFMNRNPVLSPSGASWDRAVNIAGDFVSGASEVPYLYFSSERNLRGHRIGNHVFR